MPTFIGIDVAKDSLEVYALVDSGLCPRKSFSNDKKGRAALAAWCKRLKPELCCMESTGPYSAPVAFALYEASLSPALANPRFVKSFAKAVGQRNKTDRCDAVLIADYAKTLGARLWVPPTAQVQKLCALSRRLDSLVRQRNAEGNRLEDERLEPLCKESILRHLQFLKQEMDLVQEEMESHVKAFGELKEQIRLLCSIPGIGFRTACAILAETSTGVPFQSAKELCAFAGLCPRKRESGKYTGKTLLSKQGNAKLRKALYMPAIVAIKANPVLKDFYYKLVQKGKAKMAALGACMKKLLAICFGVLKNKTEFSDKAS